MNRCNHCGKEFLAINKEKFDRHLQYVHNISMQSEKLGVRYAVNTAIRNLIQCDSNCGMCDTTLSNKCWYSEKLDAELCKSCYDSLKSNEESQK